MNKFLKTSTLQDESGKKFIAERAYRHLRTLNDMGNKFSADNENQKFNRM